MVQTSFGQTSWDTAPSGGGGRDDFLNINKDGQYTVRVLSDPFTYSVHWVEDSNKQIRKVNCAGRGCLLCKEAAAGIPGAVKAQIRYLVEVLSRDTSKCHLIEFGPQVFNGIRALHGSKHWGDPKTYDILIDRNKSRPPSGIYQVMPVGKTDMSLEDRANIKEFMERIELSTFVQPSTNESILKKLGREGASTETGTDGAAWSRPGTATVTTDAAKQPADDTAFNF